MKHKYFILLIILTFQISAFPQKEANVWYFGWGGGADFNYEPPNPLQGSYSISFDVSNSCMSDSEGNFLFATNRRIVMNKNLEVMQNGSLSDGRYASQGAIIVQKPGSSNLYYIFIVPDEGYASPPGFYYSVVDMSLDGGLGAVTDEKNVALNGAWDAYSKVMAVRHANNRDIWIITRKYDLNAYAAFLLTESGVEDNPVISYSPARTPNLSYGSMKISYNKKYLVAAYHANGLPVPEGDTNQAYDICRFNDTTGEIGFLYKINPNITGNVQSPNSVEFSPDSKLVYLCNWSTGPDNVFYNIFQYDMALIEDSAQFAQSAILITDEAGSSLQLARDGRIYCTTEENEPYDSLNVIQKPWARGTACNYKKNVITDRSRWLLPNILLDYLYRFEWEGKCLSSPNPISSPSQKIFPGISATPPPAVPTTPQK